uniref:Reverse transcriptase domain-containing protein n=1 Tax=Tanacetum cinerariifolium TaxID=118510 RepID=A0A6L2NLH1_TANCI|nr:hypothetical protein [Tanacetum cinerariifolium]
MPAEDNILLTEEHPLPAAVSPTTDSPGYILKEDHEEDDKDPKEDPDDYPAAREDDEKDEEGSSEDDADTEEEDEDEDDEEEEEHLALADSIPPPIHRVTARMSVRAQTPISLPSDVEVARILAMPTLPPSPLSPWRRAEAPSTSQLPPLETPPFLPIPLPTSSPPMLLPSSSHRADALVVTLPPRKRLCIAQGLRFKVGESSSAPTARLAAGLRADYEFVGTLDDEDRRDLKREVGYGITDTWDEIVADMQGTPVTTDVAGLSQRMEDFVLTVRQDTDEIYERLDDAQDDRMLMSSQLNMLRRDRVPSSRLLGLSPDTRDRDDENPLEDQHLPRHRRRPVAVPRYCQKMAPKRTTRSTPATTSTATSIPMTSAQVKALINQGVADALAARYADRSRNGEDSYDSRTRVRRQAPLTYLKKKMTDKYCPMVEIRKLEAKLQNLKVKGTDV